MQKFNMIAERYSAPRACGGAGDTPQLSGKSTSGGGNSCTIYSDARQSELSSAATQPIISSARRDTLI
jgi:hypothetical protein